MSNASTYTSYENVPFYRKSWFIVLAAITIAPATLYSLFTGDIYYLKKGEMVTYSKVTKVVTIFFCVWMSIYWFVTVFGLIR